MFHVRSAHLVLAIIFASSCEAASPDTDGDTEAMASDDGVPDGPCVPGQTVACGCGAAMGAAICRADGSGYDACSCDDDSSASGGTGDTSPSTASESDSAAEGSDSGGLGGVPSWTNDIVPLFESSCGAQTVGCHNREAYNAEVDKGCLNWVSFEDVPLGAVFNSGPNVGQPTMCPDLPLYERIVNRSPWQCGAFFNDPQAVLVVPGNPEESYVIQKIMGFSCDDGLSMPPPAQDIQISDAQIDVLIAWIAAGAPYDG